MKYDIEGGLYWHQTLLSIQSLRPTGKKKQTNKQNQLLEVVRSSLHIQHGIYELLKVNKNAVKFALKSISRWGIKYIVCFSGTGTWT